MTWMFWKSLFAQTLQLTLQQVQLVPKGKCALIISYQTSVITSNITILRANILTQMCVTLAIVGFIECLMQMIPSALLNLSKSSYEEKLIDEE